MENGSLMKVESIAECCPWSIGLHVNFARDPKWSIHDSVIRSKIENIAYIYILL